MSTYYNEPSKNPVQDAFEALNSASSIRDSRMRNDYLSDARLIDNVIEGCNDFLLNTRILKTGIDTAYLNDESKIVGLESLSPDATAANIHDSAIAELLDAAKIPNSMRQVATESINLLLAKMLTSKNDNMSYMNAQFGHGRTDPDLANRVNNCTASTYAPGVMNLISDNGFPAMEAFGQSTDRVLPDIRSAMAVTLLKFHRGLSDRLLHRRISDTPYVKYVVQYCEIYDMLLSKNEDHNIRNDHPTRQPFIALYADAAPVSNELQPLVPLKDNDENDQLLFDGAVKLNEAVNLFDLSRVANEFGKTHTDWTDLVSEGAVLSSVIVKFKKSSTEEEYEIPVMDSPSARFNMYTNAEDSSDRQCTLRHICALNSTSTDMKGKPTELFKEFKDNDYLKLSLAMTVNLRNKTSDVIGYGTGTFKAVNTANAAVASGATTALEGMTMTVEGYIVDARISEENLRRSNLAIQTNVRTYDYEISNGRYILVDYSLQQNAPDNIMKFVSEATSLGQDHKMLDIVTHQLLSVYDKNHYESVAPGIQNRLTTVGFDYVAGMKVRPTVYLATIDLTKVDTIRSSDLLGDIRQLVEWQLLNLISLLHQNSYYKHQLNDGEDVVYKVCTSNIIIDNLLSIPHIHNHLNKDTPADTNSGVEFRHVLPNGTSLECVSTTFNTMRDKMIIIPFRKNDPESDLNFGHNWDFGNFVGTYTYQYSNAVNKRFISNSRVQVVPTNVIGLYVQVEGLDTIINMFAKGIPTKSKLPNPSDLVVPQI